jgi:hypothetical protein
MVAALAIPDTATAHFFTQPYTLPVPFWMYAWGAAAALAFSFAIVGLFATAPHVLTSSERGQPEPPAALGCGPRMLRVGRPVGVALLALCIVCGLIGTQSVYDNFNMTFFWIVVVLCIPYLIAFVGDFYSVINPWRTLISLLERLLGERMSGKVSYPSALGYWPAVVIYMVFIWFELFARLSPRGLSVTLAAYALVNVGGAWLFGTQHWFRHGEFLGVFFRLIGRLAPVAWACDDDGVRLCLRKPLSGLLEEPADDSSLVVFILCMLASTAYDGLHETLPWVTVYWGGVLPHVASWAAINPSGSGATRLYNVWQWMGLFAAPLVYLGVYGLFAAAMRVATHAQFSARELMLYFALPLVPIVFVYHLTHYYTLALAQGPQILRLASDPFGFGWNLLGTAHLKVRPIMIDVETIWHTQVALILIGHIVSVYLAHIQALRVFRSRREAVISQLPMLMLMMLFTTAGLWILSLPLAAGT